MAWTDARARPSCLPQGRISRYLANKCSIASRIDTFSEEPTTKYGEKLREQVSGSGPAVLMLQVVPVFMHDAVKRMSYDAYIPSMNPQPRL